jgi:hypothetical protein
VIVRKLWLRKGTQFVQTECLNELRPSESLHGDPVAAADAKMIELDYSLSSRNDVCLCCTHAFIALVSVVKKDAAEQPQTARLRFGADDLDQQSVRRLGSVAVQVEIEQRFRLDRLSDSKSDPAARNVTDDRRPSRSPSGAG